MQSKTRLHCAKEDYLLGKWFLRLLGYYTLYESFLSTEECIRVYSAFLFVLQIGILHARVEARLRGAKEERVF